MARCGEVAKLGSNGYELSENPRIDRQQSLKGRSGAETKGFKYGCQ